MKRIDGAIQKSLESKPLIANQAKENQNSQAKSKTKHLTRQQINQCLMDIQDTHPLRQLVKLKDILNVFELCFPEKKKDFKFSLRASLMNEIGLKIPSSEKEIQKDPYLLLGYGINAYLQFLIILSKMFIFISIFCLPIYIAYSKGSYFKDQSSFIISKFLLGNLGGSTVQCQKIQMDQTYAQIQCPSGSVIDSDNVIFGLISSSLQVQTQCQQKAIDQQLLEFKSISNCSNYLDYKKVRERIKNECGSLSQNNCKFEIKDILNANQLQPDGDCGNQSYFFIQSPCLIPQTQHKSRLVIALMAASLGVFIYFFSTIYFQYIKNVQQNNYVDYDVKTLTAADYTVEFEIDDDMYQTFLKYFFDPKNPITEICQLKLYIKEFIQNLMNQIPNMMLGQYSQQNDDPCKIAIVTFAYDNSQIIDLLNKRGTQIKQENWQNLDKVNIEIMHKLKDQNVIDKMQKPCSVFVTFETEQGYNKACSYNDVVQDFQDLQIDEKFLGKKLIIEPASEPTDIIWENRGNSHFKRLIKKIFVAFVIIVLLSISFSAIFYLQKKSLSFKNKYPQIACNQFDSLYVNKTDVWQKNAINEYILNQKNFAKKGYTSYKGEFQCFCANQKVQGVQVNQQSYQLINQTSGETIFDEKICSIYFSDLLLSKVIGQSIAFVIIGFNIVLKTLIINLVYWIGEATFSEQKTTITNIVFYAQFFNTAFLILLVNANLSERHPKWFTKYFKGSYYDYTPDWYLDVGLKIVQTMTISAFLPYVNLAVSFTIPYLKRLWDSKFTGNKYVTRAKSMYQYKVLYSGIDYMIHFKYSDALNITFISMMYGLGIPVIFPIAAFTLFSQWICEKIQLAYTVQMPAAMGNILSNRVIEIIKFSPLFLLFNGYWMLSNLQIFNNNWSYIMNLLEPMKSGHLYVEFQINQAFPLIFIGIIAIFIVIIISFVPNKTLRSWGFDLQSKEIQVIENLPNFFKTLKMQQSNQILKNFEYIKDIYGVEIEERETVIELQEMGYPKRGMQGTPWYSLLCNQRYTDMFCFYGAEVDERDKLIVDQDQSNNNNFEQSDIVNILLNLASIPDSVIKNIDFKPGFANHFKSLLSQYQNDFIKNGAIWEFQNEENTRKFIKFVQQRTQIYDVQVLKKNNFDRYNNTEDSQEALQQRFQDRNQIIEMQEKPQKNIKYNQF